MVKKDKSDTIETGMDHRFLVLTELFLPTKGGTAVWAAEVFPRLGGKGTHIVTAKVPGDEVVDAVHPNTVHRLRLQRVWWLRPESLGMYARFLLKGLSLAMTNRFEAIHAIRALPEGLVGWVVSRVRGIPLIVYAHGEELTSWVQGGKYQAMRYALRHADQVIANSDFTREQLRGLGVADDRIVIINPGVDIERFHAGYETDDLRRSIGLVENQKLILSVGRLMRRKGFDKVIAALPRLMEQGIDAHHAIVGIGDADEEAYLRQVVEDNGVQERVHFLGHVALEDLPRWYCAADIFAMPNREVGRDTEGFGMVYVEAAACGTPSLAGLAGGTGSAVVDGETGLRVNGDDLEAVAGALYRLLVDKALASTLGTTAQARARDELSWDRVAYKTAQLAPARMDGRIRQSSDITD